MCMKNLYRRYAAQTGSIGNVLKEIEREEREESRGGVEDALLDHGNASEMAGEHHQRLDSPCQHMHMRVHTCIYVTCAFFADDIAGMRATQYALLEDDSNANEMAGEPSLFTLTCTLHVYAAHMHMQRTVSRGERRDHRGFAGTTS